MHAAHSRRASRADAGTEVGRRRGVRRTWGAAVAVLVVALVGAPSGGAGAAEDAAQVAIGTVDGQHVVRGKAPRPVSGDVAVRGAATLGAEPPAAPPLVADAGDSGFIATGGAVTLSGMAYGGAAPYRFAWSADQGTLQHADTATATFGAAGLEPGTYQVTLRITDRLGATAGDTVKVVVYRSQQRTLLDESGIAQPPGTPVVGWVASFPFTVEENTTRASAELTFDADTSDYALRLVDPDGSRVGESNNGPGEPERLTVNDPKPGEWTAQVVKWSPDPDEAHLTVMADIAARDPRPAVSAGGPYAFGLGAEQKLAGSVSGGSEPVEVAWDLDEDGRFDDATGPTPVVDVPEGRRIVTLKATDANGLERRETTSLLVAAPDVVETQTSPVTVVGIADTGINPYHQEFSAAAYPDPAILALTDNFTKHPSEYIPGYPKDAKDIPITLGKGYFPGADKPLWDGNTTVEPGELYWIPGTKIVGAVDAGGSTGVTSGSDPHPILDDNGHGSGSASVSAGNRYGYCPTCLLVVVEALDETVATAYPWVDITSHSFGYVGGAPVGPIVSGEEATKAAAERGQTVLFAAGNGVGNAFDVPINTWHSDQTGPDWNITVGAIRRDNQRAVVGDGIPVHVSAWGDGNLPSACRTGTVGQCAFGGTSAATPYTAGVFGTVLTKVRAAIGDGSAGQKDGQVVARGIARPESGYLADGELTRAELREAVLKTAYPLNQENGASPFPYPLTAPYTGEPNVLFEGYGAATPQSAERAVDVLLGRAQLPERPFEDDFFALDRAVRDTFWGGYDRDGDGESDFQGVAGGLGVTAAGVTSVADTVEVLRTAAAQAEPKVGLRPLGDNPLTYYLHRRVSSAPGVSGCAAADNESSMSADDTAGDLEPCFESRVTSVLAAYRPLGIFPAAESLDAPLPAGSTVNVELFVAGETPSMIRPAGVLMATDRELGQGEGRFAPVLGSGAGGAACGSLGEACWTKYTFSFTTDRPAFTGERLTFQVQLLGARSWAFGYEGAHASKIAIQPADLPNTGFEFGASVTSPADGSTVSESEVVTAGGLYAFPDPGDDPAGAGDHPTTRRVEVSVDDDSFSDPLTAVLDEKSQTWRVKVGRLPAGEHVLYARARIDQTTSEVSSSRFTAKPDTVVQWQIVDRNGATAPNGWHAAEGVDAWSFRFATGDYTGSGPKTIVVRLVHRDVEVARDSVRVRFR